MNCNLIKRNLSVPDSELTKKLQSAFGLHPRLAELLISRGIDTEDKARKYLYPDINDLYDPFTMKGMTEAVERLNIAIEEKQKVVIYGDYDADGICASSILSLYLSSRGLDVYVHIPNRVGDGYGLNVESIESIIDKCCPDLILTCDCGISGSEEVAYAMDLGVDVI
ncbi:MAG: DHH family phosphoesterase, partial [Clostridia bacterium]|nr:DHH family phosphoesterase [Clostridia bacterium]